MNHMELGAIFDALGKPFERTNRNQEIRTGLTEWWNWLNQMGMTGGSINNMGYLLNALGKHEDAFEVLRAGESAARRTWTGPNTRRLGNYLAKLGEAEGAMGRFAQGEATLLEAHQLLAEGFGEAHDRTTKCITRLLTLYEASHAAEPHAGYDTEAAEWRAKLEELEAPTQ